MRQGMGISLGVLVGLTLGCDPEVGEDYKGEALLQLRGSIRSQFEPEEGAVLVLTQSKGENTYLVDGVIDGEFPSTFTFSTTELPPVIEDQQFGDRVVRAASLGFAVVPKEHESIFPNVNDSESTNSNASDPTAVDLQVTNCQGDACHQLSGCEPGEDCLVQQYSCSSNPCDVIASEGDPELVSPENLGNPQVFDRMCAPGDGCYRYTVTCDKNDPSNCYRAEYFCDNSGGGDYSLITSAPAAFGPSTVLTCDLVEENGNSNLVNFNVWQSVTSNFNVVWVEEDVVDPEIGQLKAGYNIIKRWESVEAWLSQAECLQNGGIEAAREFNEANGTNYPPFADSWGIIEDVDEQVAFGQMLNEVFLECRRQAGQRVVDEPANEELTIEITKVPQIP